MVDRTHRELTDDDLAKIAGTYHAWRGDSKPVGAGLVPAQMGDHAWRGDSKPVGAGLCLPMGDHGGRFNRRGVLQGDRAGDSGRPRRATKAGDHKAGDHKAGDHKAGDHKGRPYEDIPGFCKAAKLDDIRKHGHVLTPGRYVGAEAAEDDGEPFEEKMKRLTATLREQQAEAAKLDAAIAANLKELGYGG